MGYDNCLRLEWRFMLESNVKNLGDRLPDVIHIFCTVDDDKNSLFTNICVYPRVRI